jgi:hypothetical protein
MLVEVNKYDKSFGRDSYDVVIIHDGYDGKIKEHVARFGKLNRRTLAEFPSHFSTVTFEKVTREQLFDMIEIFRSIEVEESKVDMSVLFDVWLTISSKEK